MIDLFYQEMLQNYYQHLLTEVLISTLRKEGQCAQSKGRLQAL